MDDKQLARELRAIVGDRFVLTDASELRPYECDGNTIFKKLPRAVVLPGSTEEVSRLLQLKANLRQERTRSNIAENNLSATVVQVGARIQY